MQINPETKHLIYCPFELELPNAQHGGLRFGCTMCNTGRQLSRQCCAANLCVDCWRETCTENMWDYQLSTCANQLCDDNEIWTQRSHIDRSNIRSLLGLNPAHKYRHVAVARVDGSDISDLSSDEESSTGEDMSSEGSHSEGESSDDESSDDESSDDEFSDDESSDDESSRELSVEPMDVTNRSTAARNRRREA